MFKILIGLVVIGVSIKAAATCGDEIKGFQSGQKVVGIQLNPVPGESGRPQVDQYAMDDDGMLSAALVASACQEEIPYLRLELSEAREKCVYDTQRGIELSAQLSLYGDLSKQSDKKSALTLIEEKCKFNPIDEWTKYLKTVRDGNLTCSVEALPLLKKAITRHLEFIAEQDSPENRQEVAAPSLTQDEFINGLKADNAQLKELEKILSAQPAKRGAFMDWAQSLPKVLGRYSYHLAESVEEKFDPKKVVPAKGILCSLGSNVAGCRKTRCGYAFPKDILGRMKDISWTTRGVQPKRAAPGAR
jgi:hypothetical protein